MGLLIQKKEQESRELLMQQSRSYSLDDIFNADETGLYYKMMPNKALLRKGESTFGFKTSKDRLTILLITNSTGSYKSKPVVIGKFKKPRCLKCVNPLNLLVNYVSGPYTWINNDLFSNFLIKFDSEMRKNNFHVLLYLDNASPHIFEQRYCIFLTTEHDKRIATLRLRYNKGF